MSNQAREFVDAREAAGFLGVKLQTLYAYTSRGLIESVPSADYRRRQYRRADLERLRARRDARAGHGPVAASALRFGEPVLDSSITQVLSDAPWYRGRSALELARAGTPFESVAELLWTGALPESRPHWEVKDLGVPRSRLAALLAEESAPIATLALVVPALAARDPARFDPRPESVWARARGLIPRLAAALTPGLERDRVRAALEADTVARALAIALGARDDAPALRALEAALILFADHELNASAFAARVAASAGADVYACLSAALAALAGPRHGGALDRIEALVAETGRPGRASRVVLERARRGDSIPGFGHPLYPDGDPRATPLLEASLKLAPDAPVVRTVHALVDAMHSADRGAPTIDTAIVALAAALGLPPGCAVGVFAIGRSAGWIAHILEQYEAGYLLRPRARYLGGDPTG